MHWLKVRESEMKRWVRRQMEPKWMWWRLLSSMARRRVGMLGVLSSLLGQGRRDTRRFWQVKRMIRWAHPVASFLSFEFGCLIEQRFVLSLEFGCQWWHQQLKETVSEFEVLGQHEEFWLRNESLVGPILSCNLREWERENNERAREREQWEMRETTPLRIVREEVWDCWLDLDLIDR